MPADHRRLQLRQQCGQHSIVLLPQAGNVVIADEELQGARVVRAVGHALAGDMRTAEGLSGERHASPGQDRAIVGATTTLR